MFRVDGSEKEAAGATSPVGDRLFVRAHGVSPLEKHGHPKEEARKVLEICGELGEASM